MAHNVESAAEVKEEKITPKLDLGFKHFNLSYLQHPPRIKPNYGNKKKVNILPKSNVKRVLLYDNMTQQQMLDMKLANIRIEKHRSVRLMELHRKSFVVQRLKKMRSLFKSDFGSSSNGLDFYLPPISEVRNYVPDIEKGDTKLPEIDTRKNLGNSVNGITQMFNSFEVGDKNVDHNTIQSKKSVKDPRFVDLEKRLVHLDNPGDGYLGLSPSFVKDYSNISRSVSRLERLPPVTMHASTKGGKEVLS